MTHRQRVSLFIVIDSCIVFTAVLFSMVLLSLTTLPFNSSLLISCIAILLSHHIYAIKYKLYKRLWEYASIRELVVIFKIVVYSILTAILIHYLVTQQLSWKLFVVAGLLHLFFIGGSRLAWRLYRDIIIHKPENNIRTLIVGAGSAGIMVARQLLRKNDAHLQAVAFVDDDPNKQYLDIFGLPVAGGIKQIASVAEKWKIERIIISIPSLNRKEWNTILQACSKTGVKTQILPSLEELIAGKTVVHQFRDVQVEDLLGRDPVEMDMESISDCITNKVVMVTGAGGSIGSEISRQVARFAPSSLILLGHGENSIYSIEMELLETYPNKEVVFITEIADVQDANKMLQIMRKYQPDVVYHAAAHKHVPLMERHPDEAVKNNIIGTRNVAAAASETSVDTFVMISTDKAVNPTSVMGASKRLAEMIIQDMDRWSDTKFAAVRFGNVLGSKGSVIPLFKKQIEKGGPLTVTHPEMVRYFMTIPEASRLVMQAGALALGGEIFVLDMGEPVKIEDLARNLIKLSGYAFQDIGIQYTGIRPGEKLYEELFQESEVQNRQIYPKIYVGKTTRLYMDEIKQVIETVENTDAAVLRQQLLNVANNVVIKELEVVHM